MCTDLTLELFWGLSTILSPSGPLEVHAACLCLAPNMYEHILPNEPIV